MEDASIQEPRAGSLRLARAADAADIAAVTIDGLRSYAEWSPGWQLDAPPPSSDAWLGSTLARPDVWWLVSCEPETGAVVGHVSLAHTTTLDREAVDGRVQLWQLFVTRPFWGSGVADQLLTNAIATATDRGYEQLTLWTPNGASRAKRFYERAGLVRTGQRRHDSRLGLSAVEYKLALQSKA